MTAARTPAAPAARRASSKARTSKAPAHRASEPRGRSRVALRLRRARAVLAGACCLAGVLLVFELPLGELVHQRSDLAGVEAELRASSAQDHRLEAEITSLGRPSTVAAIAHQDYGLVDKGQLSYVILPTSGSGSSLLGSSKVPAGDLVPPSVSPYAPAPAAVPARRSPGLWERIAQRLEFWR